MSEYNPTWEKIKENSRHIDWMTGFLMLGMFGILGVLIGWLGVNNTQLISGQDYHLGWLWIILIIAILFISTLGSLYARTDFISYTASMDYLHIVPVYNNKDFHELVQEEETYAEKMDPRDLDEKRWHGVKEWHDIEVTEDEILHVLDEKADDKQFVQALASVYEKRLSNPKNRPGWHLVSLILESPLCYCISGAVRNPKNNRTTPEIHEHREICVAFFAPYKSALDLKRMMIPVGGFSIPHSHADRVKFIYKRIFPSGGKQIPLYKCVDCGGMDKMDDFDVKKMDEAELAAVTIDGVIGQATRLEKKLEGDQLMLREQKAERDENENVEMAGIIKRLGTEKQYQQQIKEVIRKIRMTPKKEEYPLFWLMTFVGWGFAIFELILLLKIMKVI
jgi:uncharacterized membrane protein (DUF485 family)